MSAATVKRKAAPRKAARKGAQNGAAANGAVVHDDAAQPGLPPAEKFDAAAGLYGGPASSSESRKKSPESPSQ